MVLYGPPAAGKATVGRVLADQTGYRLLDNHVSIDAARHLFDFGAPGFWRTVRDLRLALVCRAAEYAVDIITTFVFSPIDEQDRRFLTEIRDIVEAAEGVTHFVQLRAPIEVLEARVALPSRVEAAKLIDPTQLRAVVEQFDLYSRFGADDLSIDTSEIEPAAAADRIRQHLRLDRAQP